MPFVSRAGQKLQHALDHFQISVTNKICADLGSNTGGFVDCLLQRGAASVYAIDTGYGVLDWKLRKDPRVIVMERTNAMHVHLPQKVNLVTIDVAWTRQRFILPSAANLLAPAGIIISLIKPHYEADPSQLRKGVLPEELINQVVQKIQTQSTPQNLNWIATTPSPIQGAAGNHELLALLTLEESAK